MQRMCRISKVDCISAQDVVTQGPGGGVRADVSDHRPEEAGRPGLREASLSQICLLRTIKHFRR